MGVLTICLRCHRPLKRPTESGLGPVCAKVVQPAQEVECDLFGYDIEMAVQAAKSRMAFCLEFSVMKAQLAISDAFRDARKRLGVLA